MDWDAIAAREEARYEDGLRRLSGNTEARQKQRVRMAIVAGGAGLAQLMQGRRDAAAWFIRSAERYRESWDDAPPESWGRLIGALKARVLAADWAGAVDDARWALAQAPAESASPIGRYAATLAFLIVGDDAKAERLAASLLAEPAEAFPRPVAESLAALAASDREAYAIAARAVLASFEERDAYLDDVPVADTVLVLEALARRRGIEANLRSPLLPPQPSSARERTGT
jgi:hypothetical protein